MKVAKVFTSHIQAITGTAFVATLSSRLFGYFIAVISGVVGAIDHDFIAPVMVGDSALNGVAHGGFPFFVYGGFGLLAAVIVSRYVRETKGLDNERAGAFWRRQADVTPLPAQT
jgi:hypothetical protein